MQRPIATLMSDVRILSWTDLDPTQEIIYRQLAWPCPHCGRSCEPTVYERDGEITITPATRCICDAGERQWQQALRTMSDERRRTQAEARRQDSGLRDAWYANNPIIPAKTFNTWQPRTDLSIKINGDSAQGTDLLGALFRFVTVNLADPTREAPCKIWLSGDTGVGKTHLANATAWLARERHGDWWTAPGNPWYHSFHTVDWFVVTREIQRSWDKQRDTTESEIWELLLNSWFLVLHGIDIVSSTWKAWHINLLYELLEVRNTRRLPTIFTANATTKGILRLMSTAPDGREEITQATARRIVDGMALDIFIKGEAFGK